MPPNVPVQYVAISNRGTIAVQRGRVRGGEDGLNGRRIPADADPVSQTAVDIPTAYYQRSPRFCANNSPCLPPANVSASPTVPESGRPNKRVSRKARRGPDRLVPVGVASGRLFPRPLGPTRFSSPTAITEGRGPPPHKSGAKHAEVGQPTESRAGWAPRTGSGRGRRRVLAAPRWCRSPDPAGQAARGEVELAGRWQTEDGVPRRGQRGALEAAVGGLLVGN